MPGFNYAPPEGAGEHASVASGVKVVTHNPFPGGGPRPHSGARTLKVR